MKAIFVKDFSNKKAGTVAEMTSALFAQLKKEGVVELFDVNKVLAKAEIKNVKDAAPKVAAKKPIKKAKKK